MADCEICGEPMPEGEEMFKYHGYSGPCPKPPLKMTNNQDGWMSRALKLEMALKFCRDLAEEELPRAKIGTGAEVALRHIMRKAAEALG